VGWVCGITGETVRDTVQRILLGRPGEEGTGAIPKDAIAQTVPSRGVADLLDTIRVKHVRGGVSTIGLKSYEKGREKFQGETLNYVWLDEECPPDVYMEALTRTNTTSGPVWLTFTPLAGMSEVVRRFLLEPSPDRHVTTMTIDDALHFAPEQREQIIRSYPAHEREARTRGIPTLGSGRIFPVVEEQIACERIEIPNHWPIIGGMDFGWDHPFAAVELAHDLDTDTVFVTKTFRMRQSTPILHAAALRPWGKIRWAWPRDGRRETLEGAGVPLAQQYRDQDLDLWHEHAQFEDGSVGVEAGLMDMLARMEPGRFKVFKHHHEWFDEFRLYHRRDGRVFKENDDLMSATRYAIMMLRHARTEDARRQFSGPIKFPNVKYA
jgi:phage terminase large subunit-like protein